MTIKIYEEMEQGSDEWIAARCGVLTASEMKNVITAKTLQFSKSKEAKMHAYELAAQRINNYVEPQYVGDAMLRGEEEETLALDLYDENYAAIKVVGFVTNDRHGPKLGFSPDALVGSDGMVEVKSRIQKYQVQTIADGIMQDDFAIQVQTGMLVAERDWCDFLSYSGGMPMQRLRIFPDPKVQAAIIEAAQIFEEQVKDIIDRYNLNSKTLIPTERRVEEEMVI